MTEVTPQSLLEQYQLLNDDELLAQFRSGELTDLAKNVAGEELQRRGVDLSNGAIEAPTETEDASVEGDLVMIARVSTPAEAEMLKGRLEVEGVPAVVVDAHTVQTLALFSLAVGGVRVLVPSSYADRAMAIVKSVANGDYAVNDPDR
jgi:putative signal transducing protein